jgi:hypothetical protein
VKRRLLWQSRVLVLETMLEVENRKRWKPVIITKTLFPPQPTLLIANPVKWHVCSVKGHIIVMLALRHRKRVLRRNGTSQIRKNVALQVLKLDTSRESAQPP